MPQGGKFYNRERLGRKLERMPEETRRELLGGLIEDARALMSDQRSLIHPVSGDLGNSLQMTTDPSTITAQELGRTGRRRVPGKDVGVVIYVGGEAAPYAPFVEWGTENMDPQPFFFPPYRALRQRIKRKAARLARKAARQAIRSQGTGGQTA